MKRATPADTRADFPHLLDVQTRWADNDAYGHVNNVVYFAWFDLVINRYLIDAGGLDIHGAVIGVCVESQCRFLRSVAFPERVEAGLRVEKLGTSSVAYQIGIFDGQGDLAALGTFTHVFVDAGTRRPVPMTARMRAALSKLSRAG